MLARGKAPPPSINMKKVSMLSCVALGAVLLTMYVLWISPLQQELDDANYEVISLREELAVLGRTSKAAEERSHREQRQLESQIVDLEAHVDHLQSMVDQQEAVNRNQQQLCHENAEALEDSVSGLTKLVTEQSDMLDECEYDLREAIDGAELLKESANQCQQGMQEAIADWEVWQMERVALERERSELKEAVGILERELKAAWTSAQDICDSETLLDEVDDGSGGGTSEGELAGHEAQGAAVEQGLNAYSWALPGTDGTVNAVNEAGDGGGALHNSADGGASDIDAQEYAAWTDGEEEYIRTESGPTEHVEAEYDESEYAEAEHAAAEDAEWQYDGADDSEWQYDGADDAEWQYDGTEEAEWQYDGAEYSNDGAEYSDDGAEYDEAEYDGADQSTDYNEQARTAYSEIDDRAYLSPSEYIAGEAEYEFGEYGPGDDAEVEQQSGSPLYEYDAESDQYDAESDQYDAESDQYDAESEQYLQERYLANVRDTPSGGMRPRDSQAADEEAEAWKFEDEEEDWLERTKRVAQQETDKTHKAQLLSAAEYAKKFGAQAGAGGGDGGADGERKPDAHWHPKAEEKKRAMEEAFQMMAEKHGTAGPPRAHGIGDGLDPLGNRVRQGDSPHFMFQ